MKLLQTIENCCPVWADDPLSASEAERVARAFKILGDPTRVRLMNLIACQPDDECCVCDLVGPTRLSQPTVSHHLKVLHDAGFLAREKRGTWVYYRLVPEALRTLRAALGAA